MRTVLSAQSGHDRRCAVCRIARLCMRCCEDHGDAVQTNRAHIGWGIVFVRWACARWLMRATIQHCSNTVRRVLHATVSSGSGGAQSATPSNSSRAVRGAKIGQRTQISGRVWARQLLCAIIRQCSSAARCILHAMVSGGDGAVRVVTPCGGSRAVRDAKIGRRIQFHSRARMRWLLHATISRGSSAMRVAKIGQRTQISGRIRARWLLRAIIRQRSYAMGRRERAGR